jgi:Zn-dependent protease
MLDLAPAFIISNLLIMLIALPVHEFAHAVTANAFGDDTPRLNGRLTINPLAHLDLIGTLMFILVGFGWAKPVPVDPYTLRRRSPAALMWVSLAGPMSNFLLALLAAIPLRLNLVQFSPTTGLLPSPYIFLISFIWSNLALMLFNLIPLAPLDGEKIADYFAPPPMARFLESIRPISSFLLLFLVVILPRLGFNFLGWAIEPAIETLFSILLGN